MANSTPCSPVSFGSKELRSTFEAQPDAPDLHRKAQSLPSNTVLEEQAVQSQTESAPTLEYIPDEPKHEVIYSKSEEPGSPLVEKEKSFSRVESIQQIILRANSDRSAQREHTVDAPVQRTISNTLRPKQQIPIERRTNKTPTRTGRTPKTPRTELFDRETQEMLFTNDTPHLLNDHMLSIEQLAVKYSKSNINVTNPDKSGGLSMEDAEYLLTVYGPNVHIPQKRSLLSRLCCVTRASERDRNAELPISAAVMRDGRFNQSATRDLVPGDIIILHGGQQIPADVRVIHSDDFHVENMVGGGAISINAMPYMDGGVLEAYNICIGGSIATKGVAVAVIIRTGHELHIFSRLR
jgi:hypothetical protein